LSTPLFNVGQRVRITDRTPPVHHRVPAYAKGQVGVIERVCKLHGEPEKFIRGDGKPPQRLYRVRIPQNDSAPQETISTSKYSSTGWSQRND